ncbi:hypothetical protein MCOL2_20368 [Listeria fleischmannii FSL S10-1203]|uniref:Uncharacterized protein n=1 Tax=Listeria fleischmannii FSL S10-1203 TaxID=1265822 RepID=W7DEZ7_9LIST|nr:hypothetical protein MCOL2_20368 [Listeria fleischmannii FSL S10-1203]
MKLDLKGLIEDRVLPGCDFEPARQKKTEELATMIEDIKDQQKSLETAKIVAGEKRAAYKKLADAE